MKRAHEEEPATETKQRRKVRLPQPLNIPVGTATPLRSSKEADKSSEPPMNDVLDFLVKFSDQVTQAGLWPDEEQQGVTSTASSSRPSSTNEEIPGCKAKARPPMPSVASSSSHTSGVHVATPSHGSAKALPLPVEEKYRKQQLVVNPYEMKKFLYGTSQKIPDEEVAWKPPSQGGGWFRKVGGLIACWKEGDVHRMRRLLQLWEQIPQMKEWVHSLRTHVKEHGWPKNLDGEFGLNRK